MNRLQNSTWRKLLKFWKKKVLCWHRKTQTMVSIEWMWNGLFVWLKIDSSLLNICVKSIYLWYMLDFCWLHKISRKNKICVLVAAEGLCGVAVDGHGSAVLVEINCQSDFAARGLYIYSFVCFFFWKKIEIFLSTIRWNV